MSNLNVLRERKDVRTVSSVAPAINDGTIIGETWAVDVAPYERFTLTDTAGGSTWVGTQGTIVSADPILATDHPNLVAMYTMDNINGSILVDESVNGNDGTIIGATAVAGQIGNALNFDGVNDQINPCCEKIAGTQMAIALWANVTGTATEPLFDNYGGTTVLQGPMIYTNLEYLRAGMRAEAGIYQLNETTTILPAGWQFIVVNFDATLTGTDRMKIYVGGVLQTVTEILSLGTFTDLGWSSVEPVRIGAGKAFSSTFYYAEAKIDQFRQFNRVLTQPEITALYNSGAGA